MKPPKSFPAEFALWFIGTCMNTVKHPIYGGHQLTKNQLIHSPGEYKNALYKEMAKIYVIDITVREKYATTKQTPSQ